MERGVVIGGLLISASFLLAVTLLNRAGSDRGAAPADVPVHTASDSRAGPASDAGGDPCAETAAADPSAPGPAAATGCEHREEDPPP